MSILKTIMDKVIQTDVYLYITNVSFTFLLTLFFLNPSNKVIGVMFLILFGAYFIKLNNFGFCLLLVIFVSSFFPVGKSFFIQLAELKHNMYLDWAFPLGLTTTITLSMTDIFSFLLGIFLLRSFIRKKTVVHLKVSDLALFLFIGWITLINIFVSKMPLISLLNSKYLYEGLIAYFYIRTLKLKDAFLLKLLLYVTAIVVIFESLIAFAQFIQSSPLGKSIEPIRDLIPFGLAADELSYVFRPLGTFIHPNELGIFFAAVLPLLLAGYLIFKQRVFVIGIILGFIALILTLSRSGWVAGYASTLYLLFTVEYRQKLSLKYFFPKRYLILTVIFVAILAVYSLPRIINTANSLQDSGGFAVRAKQITELIDLIKVHPFTGVGGSMSVVEAINNNKDGIYSMFPSSVHNYYMLVTIENGIPAIFLLLLFLFFLAKESLNNSKHILIVTCFCGLISILVGAIFQPIFNWLFFLILAAFVFDTIPYDRIQDRKI